MLELHIGNVLTTIEGDLPGFLAIQIKECCAYSIQGAEFSSYGSANYCPLCKKITEKLSWEEKSACPNDGQTYRRCAIHGIVRPIPLWDGRKFLYDTRAARFPTGIIGRVLKVLKDNNIEYKQIDERIAPYTRRLTWHGPQLRYYQKDAVQTLIKRSRGIIHAATGVGKCFRDGTKILMFNGTTKNVEKIQPGDVVMGIDSKPRTVVETHSGKEELYRVQHINGTYYDVTKNHILTGIITGVHGKKRGYKLPDGTTKYTGDIVDISVSDWLVANNTFKHVFKGFTTKVESFGVQNNDFPLDPYLLGIWLGDGSSNNFAITTMDKEVIDLIYTLENKMLYIRTTQKKGARVKTYHVSARNMVDARNNPYPKALHKLNIFKNKHIPDIYKFADINTRRKLLAGILDSDGYTHNGTIEIVQKVKRFADDIVFVSRSLGLTVTMKEKISKCQTGASGLYYRIHIGGDFSKIPFKIKRRIPKRRIKYNPERRLFGLKITPCGVDKYTGFSVAEEDKHVLLGDFTVVHNSNILANIISETGVNTLVLTHTASVFHQVYNTLKSTLKIPIGRVGDGHNDIAKITVAMPQSLVTTVKVPKKKLVKGTWKVVNTSQQVIKESMKDFLLNTEALLVDEAHRVACDTVQLIANSCVNAFFRVGVTATPYRADLLDILIESVTGKVNYRYTASQGIRDGYLSKPHIHLVNFKQSPYPKRKEVVDTKTGEIKTQPVKYIDLYTDRVIRNTRRNTLISTIAYNHFMKNESVLVIVRNIEHGENLYAQLKYLGDTVRWVNGENNTKELQKVLKDLNDGTCRICIASGIFNEGIDVTGLNVCINTTACDSPVTAMQILGRTLRRTSTKSKVDFYDIYDTGVRWLGEHAVNREAMYNTEEEFVITHEDENTYLQK